MVSENTNVENCGVEITSKFHQSNLSDQPTNSNISSELFHFIRHI